MDGRNPIPFRFCRKSGDFMLTTEHTWFKRRGYLHFDLPISFKQAESIVKNPAKVQRHAFYPFILNTIKSKKIQKDKRTGVLHSSIKERPVQYASHVDSHIYSYYAHILSTQYEETIKKLGIDDSVLAFRKLGKSNIDYANNAFNEIIKRQECSAVALDIEGFFDNLNHAILKQAWGKVIKYTRLPNDHYSVFKSLTKFSRVEKDSAYKEFNISKYNPKNNNNRICEPEYFRSRVRGSGLITINKKDFGIPQGSPISALLSNIYMLDFDLKIVNLMRTLNGCYYRYCDDILLILPLNYKNEIIEVVIKEVNQLKLNINNNKTKFRDFIVVNGQLKSKKPLQYLGFTFDGQHKLIRSAAFSRYSECMKSGVRLAKLTRIKYNRVRIQKGQPIQNVYRNKIYERYSHLGQRNFVRYGYRSSDVMSSNAIKKQLKPLWNKLNEEIKK